MSILQRRRGRTSFSQLHSYLVEIKRRHDATCLQSIEFYGMLLAQLLWAKLTVPMAYLPNCMPRLMSPTIAMQTRSRTQAYQYTTAASQLHLYPCPRYSSLSQTPAQRPSSWRPYWGTGNHVGTQFLRGIRILPEGSDLHVPGQHEQYTSHWPQR